MAAQENLQETQFKEKKIRPGGRPGRTDPRGNSRSRRVRKLKLLSDPKYGGNGTHVNCVHCGKQLDEKTVEQDRIKPGGPYAYHNVQPSCKDCNKRRSNNENWRYDG
jgi:hypothetical protein